MIVHTDRTTPSFKGLLLDVYGVLEFKGKPCCGAIAFVDTLNARHIPYRLLTNSTLQSRHSMADKLKGLGFNVTAESLVTASSATAAWLTSQNARTCRVIIDGKGLEEFDSLNLLEGLVPGKPLVEGEVPEYLVLGDAREGFTFANINVMYRQLCAGAQLVMMIPNLTSVEKTGPEITVGGYGTMLEAATGQKAVRIGKPAPIMFQMALCELGLDREQVLVVGDNEHVDTAGAKAAGMASALVNSGEFDQARLQQRTFAFQPDYLVDRLEPLLELLA